MSPWVFKNEEGKTHTHWTKHYSLVLFKTCSPLNHPHQNNSHYQWGLYPHLGYYQTEIVSNQPLRKKIAQKKSLRSYYSKERELGISCLKLCLLSSLFFAKTSSYQEAIPFFCISMYLSKPGWVGGIPSISVHCTCYNFHTLKHFGKYLQYE